VTKKLGSYCCIKRDGHTRFLWRNQRPTLSIEGVSRYFLEDYKIRVNSGKRSRRRRKKAS
jgi:hypothetical protein